MRVELRAQCSEPCIGELCVQPCRLRLESHRLLETRAIAEEVVAREARRQHGEVQHEVIEDPRPAEGAGDAGLTRPAGSRRTAWPTEPPAATPDARPDGVRPC